MGRSRQPGEDEHAATWTLLELALRHRSPFRDETRHRGRRGRGGRGWRRRRGVQQWLKGLPRRGLCRARLVMHVGLFEGGLQIADVLDHPLNDLELRELPLPRHIRHQGPELRQVSSHLFRLEIPASPIDPQTTVQDTAARRHSSAHRAHHHRLHVAWICLAPWVDACTR